jgi:hypothetical protein
MRERERHFFTSFTFDWEKGDGGEKRGRRRREIMRIKLTYFRIQKQI